MSTCTKQATPDCCYCWLSDENTSLTDIANFINILNIKIVRLRNEVNALKDTSVNEPEEQLLTESKNTPGTPRSCCCEKTLDTFPTDEKLDKLSTTSREIDSSADQQIHDKPENETIENEVVHVDDPSPDTKLQIDRLASGDRVTNNASPHDILKEPRKIRKKKYSKGVQYDTAMERKSKRTFLNCFRTDESAKEHDSTKHRKRRKTCNMHVTFDPCIKEDNEENDQLLDLAHVEHNTSTRVKSKMEKGTSNPFKKLWDSKDIDEDSEEFTPGRMGGGGTEFRGNHLISDFNDKMQKIHLYKSVKHDAKNVKKRLDACIVELNEIIEDVSMIFNNMKELQN